MQLVLLTLFFVPAWGDVTAVDMAVVTRDTVIVDAHGAIIRGDTGRREIALVFTGDEFADGGETLRKTLKRHHAPGSFFLTGNFYSSDAFKDLVAGLKADGHYLGAHSDKHLLYASWTVRDSLLVTEEVFKEDLRRNYDRMATYGIHTRDATFFLPPYEWYNTIIVRWTEQLGLKLINFTPGTRSHADYTYPEMGDRYVTSEAIYRSIMDCHKNCKHGLNGFILLTHIGVDPRRKDKFYNKLDDLLTELRALGYEFVSITELLGP